MILPVAPRVTALHFKPEVTLAFRSVNLDGSLIASMTHLACDSGHSNTCQGT